MISPQHWIKHLSRCRAASLLVIPAYQSVTVGPARAMKDNRSRGMWSGVERNINFSHTIPCL